MKPDYNYTVYEDNSREITFKNQCTARFKKDGAKLTGDRAH